MAEVMSPTGFPRAGLARRLAVIIYDLLVVAAILLFTVLIANMLAELLMLMAIIEPQDSSQALNKTGVFFQLYLMAPVVGFYVYFWSNGGQTVGMKAWRLRVQNENGYDISKKQAIIRFATSGFGFGNLIVPIDKDRLSLQDRSAKCEVVLLTKEANQHKNWQKLY